MKQSTGSEHMEGVSGSLKVQFLAQGYKIFYGCNFGMFIVN